MGGIVITCVVTDIPIRGMLPSEAILFHSSACKARTPYLRKLNYHNSPTLFTLVCR